MDQGRPATGSPRQTQPPSAEGRLDRLPRLNIFALPSRTAILAALIVLVILLPVFASLLEETPLLEPLIVAAMVVLPVRHFLRRPQAEMQRHAMRRLAERFGPLAAHVEWLMARYCRRRAGLLAHGGGGEPRAFGSWTRQYLAFPTAWAAQLEAQVTHPQRAGDRERAEVVLLHELAHIENADIVPMLFSRSLLRVTLLFMGTSLSVSLMTPWLYTAIVRMLDFASLWPPDFLALMAALQPEMAALLVNPPPIPPDAWLSYEAITLAAHVPLIVGSLVMGAILWTSLVRARELYADARVEQWQGQGERTLAWLAAPGIVPLLPARPPSRFAWLDQVRDAVAEAAYQLATLGETVLKWTGLHRLFALHPALAVRQRTLLRPEEIYGSPAAIGLTAGVAVALLNLTLTSLFLSRFLRGPNAFLPFVLGFTVLSVSLLPSLCAWQGTGWQFARPVAIATLVFTAIKLIPQAAGAVVMTVAALKFPHLIDAAAYSRVGAYGPDLPPLGISPAFVLDVYVFRPAVLFAVVMPLTLMAALLVDAALKRTALTWYGWPWLKRHPVALFWGLTGWLGAVLGGVMVPVYEWATVPTAHDPLDPGWLARLALTLLVSLLLAAILSGVHRRYAHRCPTCGASLPGPYVLDRRCDRCGAALQPWLVADRRREAPR